MMQNDEKARIEAARKGRADAYAREKLARNLKRARTDLKRESFEALIAAVESHERRMVEAGRPRGEALARVLLGFRERVTKFQD